MVALKTGTGEEINKNQELSEIEKQTKFLIDLHDILYKHENDKEAYIAIKDGYAFALQNKDTLYELDFTKLKNEILKDKKNKDTKKLLEILKKDTFYHHLRTIEKAIETEKKATIVQNALNDFNERVNELLEEKNKISEENSLIRKGNKDLQNQVIRLSEELESIQDILESFGLDSDIKLKEILKEYNSALEHLQNDGTIKKGKEFSDTIRQLNNSHKAFEILAKELGKIIKGLVDEGILESYNNHKGKYRVNPIALNAVRGQKVHSHSPDDSQKDDYSGTSIISGDEVSKRNVEKFEFTQILEKDDLQEEIEELPDEIYSPETIKLMTDEIEKLQRELEEKEGEHKQEIARLEELHKKELEEKENEIQARIIKAIAESHYKK